MAARTEFNMCRFQESESSQICLKFFRPRRIYENILRKVCPFVLGEQAYHGDANGRASKVRNAF
ncbi:hypothetical protein AGABI2DRAFT_189725 [Agaricus bisporus var. bisporus H97]|uniref:hypothetical protein n=1 Tax=Agaricus bisporus var. bisporus (strain H97 / ATCC MYA-4626 / FGSC 10389) TaxID=936046 RepID=UPI00029F68AE|nr:hypothetical protein AGABI2DRAFT_189725 [Agaricus bisporus var. bisporus H97]EKV51469.1 hypothetical protein AGABI2DRAFT_189725 [Agaricus bisporus var. bisporus H97]